MSDTDSDSDTDLQVFNPQSDSCQYVGMGVHPLSHDWVAYVANQRPEEVLGPVCFECYRHISDNMGGVSLIPKEVWMAKMPGDFRLVLAARSDSDSDTDREGRPASGTDNALLNWARARWSDEVKDRPLANIHRRILDATWRQVVRYAGGDPDTVLGPSHDAMLSSLPRLGSMPGTLKP